MEKKKMYLTIGIAVAIVVSVLIFGIVLYNVLTKTETQGQYSYFRLQCSPSVELVTNTKGIVVSASGLDVDGDIVAYNSSAVGKSINQGITAMLNDMKDLGYIDLFSSNQSFEFVLINSTAQVSVVDITNTLNSFLKSNNINNEFAKTGIDYNTHYSIKTITESYIVSVEKAYLMVVAKQNAFVEQSYSELSLLTFGQLIELIGSTKAYQTDVITDFVVDKHENELLSAQLQYHYNLVTKICDEVLDIQNSNTQFIEIDGQSINVSILYAEMLRHKCNVCDLIDYCASFNVDLTWFNYNYNYLDYYNNINLNYLNLLNSQTAQEFNDIYDTINYYKDELQTHMGLACANYIALNPTYAESNYISLAYDYYISGNNDIYDLNCNTSKVIVAILADFDDTSFSIIDSEISLNQIMEYFAEEIQGVVDLTMDASEKFFYFNQDLIVEQMTSVVDIYNIRKLLFA